LNPEFLKLIEEARKRFAQGKTLSLEEMERDIASMKD
jgi:hypothetical protein